MSRETKPILLIGDFPDGGGSKVYFMQFLRFLAAYPNPLEVRLAGQEVLKDEELEWFSELGIRLSFIQDSILHPKGLVKKLRLSGLSEYLFLRRLRGDYAKVVVSTNLPYKWLTGSLVWKKKYYWFVHSYPQGVPSVLTRLAAPFRRLFFSWLTRQGSRFVTVSPAAAERLQQQYYLKSKHFPMTIIPGPGQFDQAEPATLTGSLVLTLGHLERWKNPSFWLEVAIQACEQADDIAFWWAGDGSMREQIQLGIPAHLADRIKLLGYQTDVSALYWQCAVYFQPSLYESQGFGVIDAMAHGIPCVVSRVGGLTESVQHEGNGYVFEEDVAQAVSYLLDLIRDPEKRKLMGVAGRKRYHEKFTRQIWEQNMQRLLFG